MKNPIERFHEILRNQKEQARKDSIGMDSVERLLKRTDRSVAGVTDGFIKENLLRFGPDAMEQLSKHAVSSVLRRVATLLLNDPRILLKKYIRGYREIFAGKDALAVSLLIDGERDSIKQQALETVFVEKSQEELSKKGTSELEAIRDAGYAHWPKTVVDTVLGGRKHAPSSRREEWRHDQSQS